MKKFNNTEAALILGETIIFNRSAEEIIEIYDEKEWLPEQVRPSEIKQLQNSMIKTLNGKNDKTAKGFMLINISESNNVRVTTLTYEPEIRSSGVNSRSRDTADVYQKYERICTKTGLYEKKMNENWQFIRLDETSQQLVQNFNYSEISEVESKIKDLSL